MNYSNSLRFFAALHPDKECAVYEDCRVTFSQLNTRANKIAHAVWGLGLKQGDKDSVLLYNCFE